MSVETASRDTPQQSNPQSREGIDIKVGYIEPALLRAAAEASAANDSLDEVTNATISSTVQIPPGSFRCTHCASFYREEKTLNYHLLNDHKIIIPNFRCPICKKMVRDLPEHLTSDHGDRLKQPSPKAVLSSIVDPMPLLQQTLVIKSDQKPESSSIPIFLPRQPVPEAQLQKQQVLIARQPVELLRLKSVSAPPSPPPVIKTEALPMNLSLRSGGGGSEADIDEFSLKDATSSLAGSLYRRLDTMSNSDENSNASSSTIDQLTQHNIRKRRKQQSVPDSNKDDRYWARRLKNNEAAKRSRDMRIRREKIVFEENQRLDNHNAALKAEVDRLTTDNKELQLKMGLILDENERLKQIISDLQNSRRQNGNEDNNNFATKGGGQPVNLKLLEAGTQQAVLVRTVNENS